MIRIRSLNHLYVILGTNKSTVHSILTNIEEYYYTQSKQKYKRDGSPKLINGQLDKRIINPSKGQLKRIQAKIKNNILREIKYPAHIQGGVCGKDNITNAKAHKGKKFHFVTDLRSFFPSVKYYMVYESFIQQGFSADVSRILTKLTTYKGCLPQGTSTSSYLANLAALKMDEDIIKFCSSKGIIYTRFIDDLSFSSQLNFKDDISEIKKIISNHFKINYNKTYYKTGAIEITGIITKNNILKPPADKITKFNSSDLAESSRVGLQNYFNRIKEQNRKKKPS